MNIHALFGISALLSLLSSGIFAKLYLVPWLRRMSRTDALVSMVSPHMFFRFIGLSFLARGVVSPSLQAEFAGPCSLRRFACRSARDRDDSRPFEAHVLGDRVGMGFQPVGCGGPFICGISRDACSSGPRDARSRLFHPNGDRAASGRHTRTDLLASSSARRNVSTSSFDVQ